MILCVVPCEKAGGLGMTAQHDHRTIMSSNNEQQVLRQWVVAVGPRPAATCDTLSWHELWHARRNHASILVQCVQTVTARGRGWEGPGVLSPRSTVHSRLAELSSESTRLPIIPPATTSSYVVPSSALGELIIPSPW